MYYPNLCFLIIANDGKPVYEHFIKIWESYMNKYPNIRCYFIFANPNQDKDYIFKERENRIFIKCEESLRPGILKKTIESLKLIRETGILKNFEYVIRTNLSTFWIFQRTLDFLLNAPREKFFGSPVVDLLDAEKNKTGQVFGSGTAMIFSSDLIDLIADFDYDYRRADDVAISLHLQRNEIRIINIKRYDFTNGTLGDIQNRINKNVVNTNIFIVRVKSKLEGVREHIDPVISKLLVGIFYYKMKLVSDSELHELLNDQLIRYPNLIHFDWKFYLNYYIDLNQKLKYDKDTAYKHWIKHGKREKRMINLQQFIAFNLIIRDTSQYFDWKFYIDHYFKDKTSLNSNDNQLCNQIQLIKDIENFEENQIEETENKKDNIVESETSKENEENFQPPFTEASTIINYLFYGIKERRIYNRHLFSS